MPKADPIEVQGELFRKTMQQALRQITPKISDRINETSAQLARMTGLSASTFIGPLIQMHSSTWGDFCDAVAVEYISAALGITEESRCLSCGAAIIDRGEPCPKCQALPS